MRKKKFFSVTISIILIALAAVYCSNKVIVNRAEGKLFSDINSVPFNKVGLLLGTSKYAVGGHNLYYDYRIAATVNLIKNGKIKYLIISGDNGRKEYSEPEDMRADLIKAGVDSSIIYLDYAGFRTFDSVVRLKEIFGQTDVTIISQQFHNERAIYIASKEGINAIGFNATDVATNAGLKTEIREKFARVKVFLDFWFGKKPKFLGSKITIPA